MLALAVSCALIAAAAPAVAQPAPEPSTHDGEEAAKRACKLAYEAAQELRLGNKLVEARGQLRACVTEACPAFVRKDCAGWLDDVERAIPTVVLKFVDDEGVERNDVAVTVDGQPLVEAIDGRAVEIDPGEHELQFTPAGGGPRAVTVTIREGERLREIAVDLTPAPPPRTPVPQDEGGLHPAAWILYGTSAAALGAFIGLGVHSLSLEDCEPTCSDEQVDDVVLFRALADVSLGVSVLALGAAVTVTILSLSDDDAPNEARLDVALRPTIGGAGLTATVGF
jgi:hypothetical protein